MVQLGLGLVQIKDEKEHAVNKKSPQQNFSQGEKFINHESEIALKTVK